MSFVVFFTFVFVVVFFTFVFVVVFFTFVFVGILARRERGVRKPLVCQTQNTSMLAEHDFVLDCYGAFCMTTVNA